MIHWDATLALGHEELDGQHVELLRLANSVLEANARGAEEALSHALRTLISYSAEHFLYEERLMAESGYRKAELHSEHHGIVLSRLYRFSARLLSGDTARDSERVAQFLRQWIVSHLTCFDRDLARHLAAATPQLPALA